MISLCILLVEGYLKELTPMIMLNKTAGNKNIQVKVKFYSNNRLST